MNVTTRPTPRSYSFLAWLIVPMLLTWLGTNYIYGSFAAQPVWAQNTEPSNSVPTPVETVFPQIERGATGIVTLWFDDAWISQYMVAAPLLHEAHMTAAIAVPTSFIGYDNFANWAQIRQLQKDGWEITNHSVVHDCTMETWTPEKLQLEFKKSSEELWKQHLPSNHFVSPCGTNSPELNRIVQKNFLTFRGTEPGYNDLTQLDPYDLRVRNITNTTTVAEVKKWLEDAKKQNLWVILVFHQIGTVDEGKGETYSMTTENFRQVVDYIQSSKMQIAVPSQVLSLRISNE